MDPLKIIIKSLTLDLTDNDDDENIPLMRVAIDRVTGAPLGQPKPAGTVTAAEWLTREDTASTVHDLMTTEAPDGRILLTALEMVWADPPKHWPFPTFLGQPIAKLQDVPMKPERIDLDELPPGLF